MRDAIVDVSPPSDVPPLIGGADPRRRLAIHRRHFETSLVGALLDKFPATTWLIGSPAMLDAARAFARQSPPTSPCIAEYGESFPCWLGRSTVAQQSPYIRWFAELEWHVGRVSIAIDEPPVGLERLANDGDRIADAVLVVQSGVRYLASPWPIDDLMKRYLTDAVPDQYAMSSEDIWLEIVGARGSFRFDRLGQGEFVFRRTVASATPLGAAAEAALEASDSLDIGAALQRFVLDGLVTQIRYL